jgi:hypothetical protein
MGRSGGDVQDDDGQAARVALRCARRRADGTCENALRIPVRT